VHPRRFIAPLLLWGSEAAARPEAAGFVDSAPGHVRCHFQHDDDRARCDQVVVWAEEAWTTQVDLVGFRAPPSDGGLGDSDALDIYITREAGGAGQAWVDCVGGDPNCEDVDPSDGLARAPSYVVIDPRTADEDFRHYVHHEFNHTCQYGTDFAEPFLSVWEGTAVAAERWTDPTWDTLVHDFGDYQETPWMSAVLQDGYFLEDFGILSWYEYGAVAWIWFLDDRYGDGAGSIGPALWDSFAQEGRGTEPDVLDAWEEIAGGWRASMLAFAVERARMGTADGPAYAAFAEADGYAFREGIVDLLPADVAPAFPPYPLGTSYWDVAVQADQALTIAVDGDSGVAWGLVVVEPGVDASSSTDGTLDLVAVATGTWTIGVVNLGPDGMDGDDPLQPSTFRLSVTATAPPAGDTGDTGDTAETNGTPDPGPTQTGCGCSTQTASGSWLLLLAAFGARARAPRPRRLSGPDAATSRSNPGARGARAPRRPGPARERPGPQAPVPWRHPAHDRRS
jgi:hypothetical protein